MGERRVGVGVRGRCEAVYGGMEKAGVVRERRGGLTRPKQRAAARACWNRGGGRGLGSIRIRVAFALTAAPQALVAQPRPPHASRTPQLQHTPSNTPFDTQAPLKRGDGVAFDCGRPEAEEPGGSVYDILDGGAGETSLSMGAAGADTNTPVPPGTRVTLVLGQGVGQVRGRRG